MGYGLRGVCREPGGCRSIVRDVGAASMPNGRFSIAPLKSGDPIFGGVLVAGSSKNGEVAGMCYKKVTENP
jgi:hypothetical protein